MVLVALADLDAVVFVVSSDMVGLGSISAMVCKVDYCTQAATLSYKHAGEGKHDNYARGSDQPIASSWRMSTCRMPTCRMQTLSPAGVKP